MYSKHLFPFLIACLLATGSFVIAQNRNDKKFAKIERLYQSGNAKKAFKKNESLLNSMLRKGQKDVGDASKAYLFQGKILQHLGRSKDYEKSFKESIGVAKKVYGDTGRVVCEMYLGIAEAYFEDGNFRKASETLIIANQAFAKSKNKYVAFSPIYTLLLARVNTQLGYLNRADSLAKVLTPLLDSRIVKAENSTDAKGKTKFVNLPSQELKARKLAYAQVLSLKADIAFEKGLFQEADSLYKLANKWTAKNLGSKNPITSHNLQAMALIQEQVGNLRTANGIYAKSFSAVKNRQDMYYFQGFEKMIYGKMVKDKFKSTPHKSLTQMERKAKSYFKNTSIFGAEKQILEEWFLANKYKNNDVAERLQEVLGNREIVPKYSPYRIKIQEIFLVLSARERNMKSTEDTLLAIMDVAKELYGEQSPAFHQRKLDLADFYLKKMGDTRKAEEIYLKSFVDVVSKEISPRSDKYVWYMNDIGTLYTLSENFNKSTEYLKAAEKQALVNFGTQDPDYAIVLGNLANVYLNTGKYTESKLMFGKAEEIMNKGDRDDYSPANAATYQNIAEGYSTYGLYEKSEKCLDKAAKIMDKCVRKGYDVAGNSSPDEMASLYIRTGKYRDAEKILKQSIADKEKAKGKDARELIKPLNLLGRLYYTIGDYGQSEMLMNRAVKLSVNYSGDTTLRYAESLKILHKLHVAFGDYEKAEQACSKQIAITTKILGRENVNVADALASLAIIRYNQGASAKSARQMLTESNAILKKQVGVDNPFYINGLKTLAFFQMETGQLASADSLINVTENFWLTKLGKDNIYTPELDLMRGDLFRKQAKYDLALDKYDHALGLYKKQFSSKHPDYVKTLSRISKTNYAKGDYKSALSAIKTTTEGYYDFITKYFPVLSFGEKSKYWDLIKGDFEFFNSLSLKLKDQNPELVGQMYDYVLATKALLLSNSIKVRQRILGSGDKVLIAKFTNWNEKKDLYTRTLSYSSEDLKKENIDPAKLEQEINDLEKELSLSSEEFSRSFENKSFRWKDVKKALKPQEAAIEILRFRHYTNAFSDSIIYAALIVTPETEKNPELVVLPNGKQMEKKFIKYYRNTIKFKNEDELSYDIYWKAIEAKLKNTNTVYLSCEGVYNQINIETLEDSNEKYIIDKYDVILVSNTKDLVLNAIYAKKKIKKAGQNNITLIGNPQFYADNSTIVTRTIPQLAGAEIEAKEISSLYSGSKWKDFLMTNALADEEKLKSMEGSRILHVATHGYFQPDQNGGKQDESSIMKKNEVNPLFRSGILLAGAGDLMDNNFSAGTVNSQNGILTAYEAMNMNLDNTELVTLSACETGLGDVQIGEGVAGLQRSFLVAGAENVVMSLFKVNDEITEKLMLTFYEKWLKSGDKRKAFIDAKREIKSQHPESIYWGSFIMIGIN